jgi:glycosyltransferase involved in cell wall biosynthesis
MENVVATIAHALAEQGTGHVTVLTTDAGAADRPARERRGRLEIIRSYSWEFAHTPLAPGMLLRLLMLPRRAILHVHVAQALIPELVAMTAKVRCRPFVAHYHLDVDASGSLGWLFLLYKRVLLGRTLRAAAKVIVLTSAQARFVERAHGVKSENVVVIPNGVGSRFFQARRPRSMAGPLKLLFVGRLAVQKNVPLLITALQHVVTDTELAIVGDGELRPTLEALAAASAAKVQFVGALAQQDLLEWYAWADAFVLTSEREGMPLVLLEAMAAGLPIIATDVPGIREFLGEDGMLVDAEPFAVARAIDRLRDDINLQRTLSQRSSVRASRYRWDNLMRQLTDLYDEVALGC